VDSADTDFGQNAVTSARSDRGPEAARDWGPPSVEADSWHPTARVGTRAQLADSATQLDACARGRVIVCGSHGGRYAAICAARWGIRAIVFNDAGVGRDNAGIAGLDLLQQLGIAAAAVAHDSADIGDARDTLERGVLSHANAGAENVGCVPGTSAADAAELLERAPVAEPSEVHAEESRTLLRDGQPRVWALDSAALVGPDDAGDVVLTGSHGGLVGRREEAALKADALAAVFNDAGGGAGTARLPALDRRRIAAATVAAGSARIGDGRSTYHDGVLSAVNEQARALGAAPGMTARRFVDMILAGERGRSAQ
jgi:hypothetical protein